MQNFSTKRQGHCCDTLVEIFDRTFLGWHTQLVGGASEPMYLPVSLNGAARILFTKDYFASALHEVAHWCIAGNTRRMQVDYGYWYAADGRNAYQQTQFEKVEAKPQALEWMFATACDYPFRISADNVNAALSPSQAFREAIWCEVVYYCQHGLPERAQMFIDALADAFGVLGPCDLKHYGLAELK